MNAPLFRPEVVQARRQDWLGRISLAQPMPVWVGAVFALLAAAAVACLLLFGEYAHRSRVVGQLVPDLGVSTVVAPTPGMVGRMTVEEGASVARDQALVRIDLPRVAASGADAHTVIGRGLDDRDSSSAQLAQAQLAQLAVQEQGQRRQLAMLPKVEVHPMHISSEVYSSTDHRLVVISKWRGSTPEEFIDPPSHLVSRRPQAWDFTEVDR